MASIQGVTIKDNANKDIDLDKNNDGKIDKTDNLSFNTGQDYHVEAGDFTGTVTGDVLNDLFKSSATFIPGENQALETFLASIFGDGQLADAEVENLVKEFTTLKNVKASLETELKTLVNSAGEVINPADMAKVEILKQELANIQEKFNKIVEQLKTADQSNLESNKKEAIKQLIKEASIKDPTTPDSLKQPGGGKATISTKSSSTFNSPGAGGSAGGSAGGNGMGGKAATGGAFGTPGWGLDSGMGAKAAYGTNGFFNPASLMQMDLFNDAKFAAFDQLGKSQKQQQMMLLYFYFARMAMSGDMGAMYQFMMFLTTIISKDKAMQNLSMGNKLIELQDRSRIATEEILKISVDNDDPASMNKMQQALTKNKTEEGAIATSQKLISQMMEEMAQVVETLTNATKGALEAHGRILRSVSRAG